MRHPIVTSLAAIALAALPGAIGYRTLHATTADDTPGASAPAAIDPVGRGKYLVSAMGCHDCHTPWKMGAQGPEPDMTRALSGHPADATMPAPPKLPEGPWNGLVAGPTMTAWSGGWGVSFTANLTPDAETGLGKWTEEMFITAIRTGRHEGKGRPILPPMPWPMYRNLNDEDLRAIFHYLRSVPAIRNRVPQPIDPPEAE